MTPDRWNQIKSILNGALDLPESEREAFLGRACAGDEDLRKQVEAFLHPEKEVEVFLEAGAPGAEPDLIGTQIGPYRILKELGRGGMGQVFLVERADAEFRQRVALKLVKRGMDTDAVLARFRHERQILASLEHPNIARLYDGGLSDDGRPFFVMEYVEGEPITSYCDRKLLTTEARLQLFRSVCLAVQHAHRNLVVHRDLKPSNILVTESGDVKLLDFGIAKLLSEGGGGVTMPETQTGLRLMTPEYAAPEQVRGDRVTTATDVYQLGIVLYELLTGHRPYQMAGRLRAEVERVILEEMPTRPSTSITESTHATTRGTNMDRLRRRLSGDLDTIVLKALRKDADRRYGSVEQLSADVHRHLVGLPVEARGEKLRYLAAKFLRRHRVGLGFGGAVVALLVLLGFYHTIQVTQERDIARQEAAKSAQVSAFMTDLFNLGDPNLSPEGDTTTVKTLLRRGVEGVRAELAEQPDVQAHMEGVLGGILMSRGQYDPALDLFRHGASLHRGLGSDENALILRGQIGEILRLKGEFADAEPLMFEVLDSLVALQGSGAPSVARVRNNIGRMLYLQGKGEEALELFTMAVEARRKYALTPKERIEQAQSLNNLGSILWSLGRFKNAEGYHLESIALIREIYGDTHPTLASSLDNMGSLYMLRGSYLEAEPLYREAHAMNERLLGENHVRSLISTLNLGLLLAETGDYPGANHYLADLGSRVDSVYGSDHFLMPYAEGVRSLLLFLDGRYPEAAALMDTALASHRRLFGESHKEQAMFLVNAARIDLALGELDEAETALQAALGLAYEAHADGHADVAKVLYVYGNYSARRGDLAAADTSYRKALSIFDEVQVPDHVFALTTRRALGRLLVMQNKGLEAIPLIRAAMERHLEVVPAQLTERARMGGVLGAALIQTGEFEEAETLLLRAHERLQAARDATPPDLAVVRADLVALYEAMGQGEEAALKDSR